MDNVQFDESRTGALSRDWTPKPLRWKSSIENWLLRICYLFVIGDTSVGLAEIGHPGGCWNR